MGGCASAPKELNVDAGSAPPPEPPKEEFVVENKETEKAEEDLEKVEDETVDQRNIEDRKSLGSLLDDENEGKNNVSTEESKAKEVPYEKEKEQLATKASVEILEKEEVRNAEAKSTEEKKEDL